MNEYNLTMSAPSGTEYIMFNKVNGVAKDPIYLKEKPNFITDKLVNNFGDIRDTYIHINLAD